MRFQEELRSSIHLKIEKDDDGTVVAYPALRQTCNPPAFGFCSHCLVGLDSNESGSLRRQFRFIYPDHSELAS